MGNLRQDGVIDLPGSKFMASRYITNKGDKGIALIVEDGDFWPYVCKIDVEEAIKFRATLDELIKPFLN